MIQIDSSIIPDLQLSVWETPLDPAFYVDDHGAESLGCYVHTDRTAFAVKHFNDFTSWYIAMPFDDVRLMQYIFQKAGVHFYNKSGNDIFYAGNGLLVIHTKIGGQQTIFLKNGRMVNINLSPLSTTILDSETGKILFSNF